MISVPKFSKKSLNRVTMYIYEFWNFFLIFYETRRLWNLLIFKLRSLPYEQYHLLLQLDLQFQKRRRSTPCIVVTLPQPQHHLKIAVGLSSSLLMPRLIVFPIEHINAATLPAIGRVPFAAGIGYVTISKRTTGKWEPPGTGTDWL